METATTPLNARRRPAESKLWDLGDDRNRVPGQRKDAPDNEKWSGRWESNPNGWPFKAYKIRRFVVRFWLRAIGVRFILL